ncbi:Ig-like domain-containing protein [Lactococcus hodotermopsidis]|uniref:Ig-like domain-containing protein n=1 Tax=Pseudolactococcus hodotermopsidis TaxID=2709157 RepID=UPI00225E5492|nr:Ig-like domain-containing protein [Lactococcus hodotermopsidis]
MVGKVVYSPWVSLKISYVAIQSSAVTLPASQILPNATLQAKLANTPSNANLSATTWETSDNTIATVSNTGQITAKKVGTVKIRSKVTDVVGKVVYSPWVSLKISYVAIQSSAVTLPASQILPNATLQAKLANTPSNANLSATTWETSDSTIATVSNTGLITAKKSGAVKIRSKVTDVGGKIAYSAWVALKISYISIQSSTVTLPTNQLLLNATLQAKVTNTPNNANLSATTWEISDSTIATVSSTGLITAKKAGVVSVRSKVTDKNGKIVYSAWTALTVKNNSIVKTEQYTNVTRTGYKFYAIDQDARNDKLLADDLSPNNSSLLAKKYHGVVVQADKEGKALDGNTYVHIKVSNVWKWILKAGLSNHNPLTGSDKYQTNNFNKSGQIVFKIQNTKFSANIREAVKHWNTLLGETVLIEASKTTKESEINLVFNDYYEESGILGSRGSYGFIKLNTFNLGTKYSGNKITNVTEHEIGHALGIQHTGEFIKNPKVVTDIALWSWSDYKDVMWSSNLSNFQEAQSIITPNDVNTVKLVRAVKDFRDTHPMLDSDSEIPQEWDDDAASSHKSKLKQEWDDEGTNMDGKLEQEWDDEGTDMDGKLEQEWDDNDVLPQYFDGSLRYVTEQGKILKKIPLSAKDLTTTSTYYPIDDVIGTTIKPDIVVNNLPKGYVSGYLYEGNVIESVEPPQEIAGGDFEIIVYSTSKVKKVKSLRYITEEGKFLKEVDISGNDLMTTTFEGELLLTVKPETTTKNLPKGYTQEHLKNGVLIKYYKRAVETSADSGIFELIVYLASADKTNVTYDNTTDFGAKLISLGDKVELGTKVYQLAGSMTDSFPLDVKISKVTDDNYNKIFTEDMIGLMDVYPYNVAVYTKKGWYMLPTTWRSPDLTKFVASGNPNDIKVDVKGKPLIVGEYSDGSSFQELPYDAKLNPAKKISLVYPTKAQKVIIRVFDAFTSSDNIEEAIELERIESSGKSNTPINYDLSTLVKKYETKGYYIFDVMTSSNDKQFISQALPKVEENKQVNLIISDSYDSDDNKTQYYNIVLNHQISENKTDVSRTIHYVYEDGTTALPDDVDSLALVVSYHDLVTKSDFTFDMSAEVLGTFSDKKTPAIEGYSASEAVVKGEEVTLFDKEKEWVSTVIYKKDTPIISAETAEEETSPLSENSDKFVNQKKDDSITETIDKTKKSQNLAADTKKQLPNTNIKQNLGLLILGSTCMTIFSHLVVKKKNKII